MAKNAYFHLQNSHVCKKCPRKKVMSAGKVDAVERVAPMSICGPSYMTTVLAQCAFLQADIVLVAIGETLPCFRVSVKILIEVRDKFVYWKVYWKTTRRQD